MSDPGLEESPLDAAADLAGERVTEVFSLLGNEARLAILLALWEAYEPFPDGKWDPTEGNAVAFSDLRERVGMRDSGQFNYHLDKLEGHFVEQTDEGYQLRPAGQKLVRTVIGGAGFEEPSVDPTPIDLDCQHCGAPTAMTYQNQRVYQVCTECEGSFQLRSKHPPSVLSAWMADPNVLRGRSTEGLFAALNTQNHHEFAMRVAGVCPQCSGVVESTLDVCDEHDPGDDQPCPACDRQAMVVVRYVCTACKHTSVSSLNFLTWTHPAVGAFAWRHGVELGYGSRDLDTARWLLSVESDQEIVETEPASVRVTHRYDGDGIALTFDDELNVVEVDEVD